MTRTVRALLDHEGIFVSTSVLLETYWVVRSRMGHSRERSFAFIRDLIRHPAIEIQDGHNASDAVDAERAGLEFDDLLHLYSTPKDMVFLSYDKQLVRRARRADLGIPASNPGERL